MKILSCSLPLLPFSVPSLVTMHILLCILPKLFLINNIFACILLFSFNTHISFQELQIWPDAFNGCILQYGYQVLYFNILKWWTYGYLRFFILTKCCNGTLHPERVKGQGPLSDYGSLSSLPLLTMAPSLHTRALDIISVSKKQDQRDYWSVETDC